MKYEDTTSRRVSIAGDLAAPTIRIKAKKNYFQLFFLLFWFCGWSIGGFVAGGSLLNSPGGLNAGKIFIIVWMGAWAIGWLYAFFMLLWMLTGYEVIELRSQALVHRLRAGPFSRQRRFDPLRLRNLRTLGTANSASSMMNGWALMGLPVNAAASMAFDYGARTIYFAFAIDPAEGEMIEEAMIARLGAKAGEQYGS
ncbi:hypothetical protein [Breoghania sp.]|uniref:hypothetical protein n=1 Tax=Breoghania sp. TaxID=2065378 RepID=UPI0029C9D7B8|nr:hypothetical protein [Breoghania sp.]